MNSDFVLIEGYKKQKFAPAVYLLNEQNEHPMLEEPSENLIAVIGQATENPVASEIPYFHREDIAAIKEFLQLHFDSIVNRRSLKGLILAGGHSTRMGEDKASLSYHGQSQLAHGAFLLSEYCSEVFVSCRANQKLPEDAAHLPVLEDKLLGMGPMSGIFSAFQEQNDAAWLVIACDLPLLNEAFLKQLLEGRNPYRFATSFKSTSCPFPEPLCSIYEPKIYTRLCQAIGLGIECPRKVLINSPISLLLQGNENILDNANTQEDRDRMRKQIQGNEL